LFRVSNEADSKEEENKGFYERITSAVKEKV